MSGFNQCQQEQQQKKKSVISVKLLSQYWHTGINLGWHQDSCIESGVDEP